MHEWTVIELFRQAFILSQGDTGVRNRNPSPSPALVFNYSQQAATERCLCERCLIAYFTDVCKAVKAEIVGIDWLTREVSYQASMENLDVVCAIDTKAEKPSLLP
jgi:hypothetical protein